MINAPNFKPGDRVRFRDGASTHTGTVDSVHGRSVCVTADPEPAHKFLRRTSNLELIDENKPVDPPAAMAGKVT